LYAELLARTHYSFLRSSSRPDEFVEQASKLGLPALGISDRNGVYGIPKAYRASQDHSQLKLITGAELTLSNLPHLNLLAINRAGYGLICRLLTKSHEGKPKGEASLEWREFSGLLQTHSKALEGVIAIPQYDWKQTLDLEFYRSLKNFFGDRLYLPLSKFLDGHDAKRETDISRIAREIQVKLIATNRPHYHEKSRGKLHDVMRCIDENISLDEAGYEVFSNREHYLKSPEEMTKLFWNSPDTMLETLRVAERCTFSPSELRYHYPSEWIPKNETAQSYLERMTLERAIHRYPAGIPPEVRKQLSEEFRLIEKMRFSDYFLTIWEIVEFAKERGILCQGRGSAANSAVCYCLGITAIDPVQMKLLFARFISEERNEPPDIDVDFEHERREEVIQHIYHKYGRDRAGMVAALITYREKSAKRDVMKAFGMDPQKTLLEQNAPAVEIYNQILGMPRHLSIHSGGFTLSADPIIETVPIEPARMEGRTIVQWDKDDLEYIGLLKVDILALGMLTALRKTLDLVKPKKELALYTIPADDVETYQMIHRGETVGVFQIESRAQISMVKRLKPNCFYDLVIEVAIVRPGPIVGEMVNPYLKRRRGLESSESPHPALESILGRTLGVPLFQEQVMQMAIALAGFTPGEADQLRRAIGAWRSSGSMEKMGRRLMEGLRASGLSEDYVNKIFGMIQGFSEYGFPESHAASFALLAYASSYLKCHYPAEFACALVNSQPMGFYTNHTILDEVKRNGVVVLPFHPNVSEWDCTLEVGAIRVGWRLLNGLGETSAHRIIEERRKKSFQSLADFLWRVSLFIKPQVLNALAMGNSFECFGYSQRDALWEILANQVLSRGEISSYHVTSNRPQQLSLFEGLTSPADQCLFKGLSEFETIRSDYHAYGVSTRGHPMEPLRKITALKLPKTTSSQLKLAKNGSTVRIAGLIIVRQRPPTAKGTCFATLEDEDGFLDLILHKEIYEKNRDHFNKSPFLIASGRLQKEGDVAMNLIVQHIQPIPNYFRVDSRDFR